MNNREIKFRAWDKNKKKMRGVVQIDWYGNENTPIDWNIKRINATETDTNWEPLIGVGFDEFELMQFTGLKDNNGKEIYEGDLIKGWIPNSEVDRELPIGEIKWCEDGFAICDIGGGLSYLGSLISCTLNNSIEIIGNIYENKELL